MRNDNKTSKYEEFCRLMTEENLYVDPTLRFTTLCRWLGADSAALDRQLEEELGFSGDALIAHLRDQQTIRLRDNYGIIR